MSNGCLDKEIQVPGIRGTKPVTRLNRQFFNPIKP